MMAHDASPPSGRDRWLRGFAAAARTFSFLLGAAGMGLLGGLGYGAWVANQTAPVDEFFAFLGLGLCLLIYGTIGFVGGLAVALLLLIVRWILRLARRITAAIEAGRAVPGVAPDRNDPVDPGVF